jgi:hypothetical protein
MAKAAKPYHKARYIVTNGLAGCYLPDNHSGPMEFTSRRELAEFIRHELEYLEFPASLFAEVNIRRLWRFIQNHGSSTAHFSLHHKGYALEFHGLTEDEAKAQAGGQR